MKSDGRRAWRRWLKGCRKRNKGYGADIGRCLGRAGFVRRHRGSDAGQSIPKCPKVLRSKPFTARFLCGMTQGARKRIIRSKRALPNCLCGGCQDVDAALRELYQVGERLRPCPGKHGCANCTKTCGSCEDQCPDDTRCPRCGSMMTTEGPFCDGSGVVVINKEPSP